MYFADYSTITITIHIVIIATIIIVFLVPLITLVVHLDLNY